MDLSLLSKMIYQLALEHDVVGLPGFGALKAEMVGATFSDKGFTINPPYRTLVFDPQDPQDDLLVDFYASQNNIDTTDAKQIVEKCIDDMREELYLAKSVELKGLGKLRATADNKVVFFVCDADLNIYREGFGLEPVSLKNTQKPTLPELDFGTPEPEESVVEASPEETIEIGPSAEEVIEVALEDPAVAEEPAEEQEPKVEPVEEPEPAVEPVAEQTVEPVAEPAAEPEPQPAPEPESKAALLSSIAEQDDFSKKKSGKGFKTFLKVLLIILIVVVVLAAALRLIGIFYPELIDKILYSPEEFKLLHS